MKSVTSPDISSRPYLDRLTRLRLRVRLLPRLHLDIACLALPEQRHLCPRPPPFPGNGLQLAHRAWSGTARRAGDSRMLKLS